MKRKKKPNSEITVCYHGEEFYFTPTDERIRNEMIETGTFYEFPMLRVIELLGRRGLYIDCGASFLNHTTFFSHFCPSDAVIAIDPLLPAEHSEIWGSDIAYGAHISRGQYYDREKINSDIIFVPAAVGAYMSRAVVNEAEHDGSTTITEITAENEDKVGDKTVVDIVTIDSLVAGWMCDKILDLRNILSVAVIKIDVEGYEWDVLQGSRQTIAKWKPELFIEIWNDGELRRITQWLREFGYEMKERYNHAPTYHFSCNAAIPVTYKKAE